ncbi:MerR family transcriptional regulator [Sediminitomix flava]|uniref:Transcriptional regulator n=1 Tax=Sediminitomix flava TaxID=379075 RepID=A0A315ZJ13_SEDFL|nr:MerR family transcriptional regulator [Sediminitomix flava]PWJ44684.1 transcriptional regulator [Sediminitomix flava]
MQNQIYSIEEAANALSIKRELLLRWMDYFEVKADKSKMLTKEQLTLLRTVQYLLHEKGYTMEGAKAVYQNKQTQLKEAVEIIDELSSIKTYLLNVKSNLQEL